MKVVNLRSIPFITVLLALLAGGSGLFLPLYAVTGDDLTDRIIIDGYSEDFELDESIFGITLRDVSGDGIPEEVAEERLNDSKWGFNNDINQIKISWDAENLYVAVDGISWNNNIILLFDYLPGGLDKMTELNAWRRNFTFSNGFFPDLFLATWDGNTTPQIWRHSGAENTVTQIDINEFETVASFAQGAEGRSMEARIPWTLIYGDGLERAWNEEVGESTYALPAGISDHFIPTGNSISRVLRVSAVLTAGGDGTGGPDSAPDNFGGHTISSSDIVGIDNYVIVPLDLTYYTTSTERQIYSIQDLLDGETVVDSAVSDSMPDLLEVNVKERITFLAQPPIRGITFDFDDIVFDRPILSPEEGDILEFKLRLDPDLQEEGRNVALMAEVYDMDGRLVKTLFDFGIPTAGVPAYVGEWDGRDEAGHIVPGGIYLLRMVVEPGPGSLTKAFSVVR